MATDNLRKVCFRGATNTSNPATTSDANRNFMGFWTRSNAATGDSRGMYVRHYIGSTGSGEAVRAYATAAAANVATGGTINGMHCSLSLAASASVSGQGFAARFTLDAAADTRTINGNLGVINVDSNIATGNTVPATVAFIKATDTGAVPIKNLLCLPVPGTKSSGDMFLAVHADRTVTHAIQITDTAGTPYWISVSTDTPPD